MHLPWWRLPGQFAADFRDARWPIIAEVSHTIGYPAAEGTHAIGLRCDFVAVVVIGAGKNVGIADFVHKRTFVGDVR